MRDSLCDEEHLRKMLVFNESLIKGDYEKIEMLKDDIAKGIQRYPLPPGKVIDNIRRGMVRKIRDLISNKYSLGLPCDELEDLYEQWVSLLQEVDFGSEGFLNWCLLKGIKNAKNH